MTSEDPAPLSATHVGLVLVDELARQGITDVVISPGSRSAPLALAAAWDPRLRVHVRIDERTAGFLALGLARGSGRPAAVLCSSGTATAGYHAAVIEADAAGVPMVVLTADRPVGLRATGANQTITQAGLYGGAVRWAAEVGEGDERYLRSVTARAVARATGRWPGPVHLNVPFTEPLLDTDSQALAAMRRAVADAPGGSVAVAPGGSVAIPVTPTDGADEAARLLAERPGLIIAGEGAAGDADLLPLAARLGLPVLAEPTSGLRLATPALRAGHWLAASPGFTADHRPEVVIQLGRPVLSRPIAALVAAADVVINCDPLDRGWDPQRLTTHAVVGRLQDWAAGVANRDRTWLDRWLAADELASRVLDEALDGVGAITELGITRDLGAAMPEGSQLVVASSLPIRHLNEVMRPRGGLRVIGNRGASGIDGFTSTAVGAALGFDGPTAALAGDLSVIHDLTGLVIGADEPMPSLPIVVLNNDGGGIFDLLPYSTHVDPGTFRRVFATPHGLPLHGLGLTMGHGFTHVDETAEFAQVLEDAWASPGITLIEITTDTPTETARHRAITAAVGEALTTR
ncbi:2-succinyl-5-enolpyruvyl-6-hydroxy-3-cyclohexene-1-carboxylic-acid synthase [soil metagenome]